MKKGSKIALGIISVSVALCMGVSLAACSSNNDEHTHSYSSEVTKEATCTEDGVMTYTCDCGDSYTETIPALGHDYQVTSSTEVSCTEDGVVTSECSRCGDTQEVVTQATGHVFGTYAEYLIDEAEDDESEDDGNTVAVVDDEDETEDTEVTDTEVTGSWYASCTVCGAVGDAIAEEDLANYTLIADSEVSLNAALAVAKAADTVDDEEVEATADDDEAYVAVTKILVQGTIELTDVLNITSSNVVIDGAGTGAIKVAAIEETGTGIQDCGIQIVFKYNDGTPITNVTFKDLTIDGSNLSSMNYNTYMHTVEIMGGQDITFSGCTITNENDYDLFGDSAILINSAYYSSYHSSNSVYIDNCNITAGEDAIITESDAGDTLVVTNSTIVGRYSIVVDSPNVTNDISVSDSTLDGAIEVWGGNEASFSFTNCSIEISNVSLENSTDQSTVDPQNTMWLNANVTFTNCTIDAGLNIKAPGNSTGYNPTYTFIGCSVKTEEGTVDLTNETLTNLISNDYSSSAGTYSAQFVFSADEDAQAYDYQGNAITDSTTEEGNDDTSDSTED